MPHQQDELRDLVARRGVVGRRDHPALAGSIDRLLRSGELAAVLPGVYADAARASTF